MSWRTPDDADDLSVPAGLTATCGSAETLQKMGKLKMQSGPGTACDDGNVSIPSDIVSKTSLSIACTMAICAAPHFAPLAMLAVRSSTKSNAAGDCLASALNLVHSPNPSGVPESK